MSAAGRICHEGVEGLRVGRFPWKINTTCILYRVGSTVIDAGPPNQWAAVRRFLRERPVERLLLTHHHEDHSGNGARIRAELGVEVLSHAASREYLAKGFEIELYRRAIWGVPPLFVPGLLPEQVDAGGGMTLRVIHTPGHAVDLCCFLEPRRGWLFTGDLFISSKPRYLRRDEDPNREIESLREVLRFEFGTVFCSHRGPIARGREAIQEKLDYLQALRDDVVRLAGEGRSIDAITRELVGSEDFLTHFSRGHFSKRNLIQALASHETREGASGR